MLISRSISGLRRPKQRILGNEFAGEVAGIGAAVTEFVVGDAVYGDSGFRFGAHAEFMCMRASAADRAYAGQHELRGSGGGLRRRPQRLYGV